MSGGVVVHPEIEEALNAGRAVVALETAVVTAGLPREPLNAIDWNPPGWRHSEAVNLELGLLMMRLVREFGAVPAATGVLDGTFFIGLDEDQLYRLAAMVNAKTSVSNLAHTMTVGASAGTTVSATLAGCRLTPKPVRVFATGGIGGVHSNWAVLPDVSADLRQMAVTPTCVVCSGGKSILDLPATLEILEAMGVPVVGLGSDYFPQFQSLGTPDIPTPRRVDELTAMAQLCQMHWSALHNSSGVLLANPVPSAMATDPTDLAAATAEAERLAAQAGIAGERRTPYLLGQVARLTGNQSLLANLALLAHNAEVAAKLAVELATLSE